MGKEKRETKDRKGVKKSGGKKDKKDRGRGKEKRGKDKKGKRGRDDDSREGSCSDSYEYDYTYESDYGSDSRSPSRGRRRGSGGDRRGRDRSRSRGRRGDSRRGRSRDGYKVRGDAGARLLPTARRSPPRRLQQLGNMGSGDNKDDMEKFIGDNELDTRTVEALEALSETQQKKVMGTDGGENSFELKGKVNNPNAVVMSRIRRL
mmetsp:Transcript_43067/g.114076  ORF Transcript_43067/g.114076 Transcript_43067/m.114076 type:complete len:205 (-) Transcript_43067:65-679(-)